MESSDASPAPHPAEASARSHVEGGDTGAAATELIAAYGPELLGWLHAVAPSEAEGDDVFSIVCERLWKSLPSFEWSGSIRTWMYVVGRNALRDAHRRQRRRGVQPLSRAPELAAVVRSTTAAYRKTAQRDRLAQLRAELDPEERALLILRLDRQLAWRDIAEILSGEDADEKEVTRAAARARKQFARLKDRLRVSWGATR